MIEVLASVLALVGRLAHWWRRRDCWHPVVRGIHGDERRQAGYRRYRCRECGKALDRRPVGAVIG